MAKQMTPYDTARFEYEFLGKDIEDLAKTYALSPLVLETIAESWERKIEPTALPQSSDISEFAKKLEEITRSQLTVISLFRQLELQPLYTQLEQAILGKALDLVDDIHSMDDKAATKLLSVTKTLMSIQERNPIDLAKTFQEALKEKGSSGIVVNIANQVN